MLGGWYLNRELPQIRGTYKLTCRLLGEAYTTSIQDSDPRLQNLKPPFEIQIRSKAKEVLVEDELARRR
jgi:hypothetical protein